MDPGILPGSNNSSVSEPYRKGKTHNSSPYHYRIKDLSSNPDIYYFQWRKEKWKWVEHHSLNVGYCHQGAGEEEKNERRWSEGVKRQIWRYSEIWVEYRIYITYKTSNSYCITIILTLIARNHMIVALKWITRYVFILCIPSYRKGELRHGGKKALSSIKSSSSHPLFMQGG